jgi:hypothetical protein
MTYANCVYYMGFFMHATCKGFLTLNELALEERESACIIKTNPLNLKEESI